MNKLIKVNNKDNVATCTKAIKKGEVIELSDMKIEILSDIPRFHKVAMNSIKKGGLIYKYGEIIGDALEDINVGEHVHVHNVESTRGRGDKK